jgi:hypothetical protein
MRYAYRPREEEIEARRSAAMDVLTAVALGLCGATFFFVYL